MKVYLNIFLVAGVIFCHQLKACMIVDPTYDDAFKTLFGESEQSTYNGISAKQRLIDFLNSILFTPFDIQINDLTYISQTPNAKGSKAVEFDLLCECKHKGKKQIINIEMQREYQEYFIQRMTFYGAKAMATNFEANGTYDKIPQTIVISILDDYLEFYKRYAAFYTAPSFHKLVECSDIQGTKIMEGKVVDTNLLHICIQLPVIAHLVINQSTDDFSQNLWLQLLASRRICNGNIWQHRDAQKIYDMTQDDSLLKLATSNEPCIKSALKLLQTYASKNKTKLKNLEAMLQKYITDENTKLLKEKQLVEKERLLAEKEQRFVEKEQIFLKKIIKEDIKKRKKYKEKEEKEPKLPFKYSRSLKNVEKKTLQLLFSQEYLQKPEVVDDFSNYPVDPSNSDDYSIETDDDE